MKTQDIMCYYLLFKYKSIYIKHKVIINLNKHVKKHEKKTHKNLC
jgi:hypothetical protein